MTGVEVERIAVPPAGFDRLVSTWRFKPYRWIPNVPPHGVDRMAAERTAAMLREPGRDAWAARSGGALVGLAVLQPLDWDTRVLGMSAARVELMVAASPGAAAVDALLDAVAAEARRRRVRHLSARVDAADDAAVQGLELRGFVGVDALLTFEAATTDLPPQEPLARVTLRPGAAADTAAVAEIAAASFRHGRFHADPAVPPDRAQAVYRTWAAACCERTAADAVIVAEVENQVAGFVACREMRETAVHLRRATGTIPLIATADGMRGRGIGRALVAAAAGWFRERDAAAVEIGTQLRNVAAARLYERCGFRLVSGSLSFRLLIEP